MPRPALYQIVDFPSTYQHYRSEKIDNCSWFRNPVDLDIQWANVMSQGLRGAAVYGLFQSLLKVCGRQRKPRLGFLTHDGRRDGRRYSIAEIAMLLYQTEEFVEDAFNLLASPEVNWLAVVDPANTSSAPRGDTERTSSAPQAHPAVTPSAPHGDTERTPRGPPGGPYMYLEDISKYPPSSPQGGIGDISVSDAQKWLNSFFGRQEAWSYEETSLLSELLPIPKETRALLSWAYKLPRDKEGWAMASDRRLSKPKHSLLVLLREFQSEVDKWRTVRTNLNGSRPAPDVPVPREWVAIGKQIYGPEWEPPPCVRLLAMSMEEEIKAELEKQKHASAAA